MPNKSSRGERALDLAASITTATLALAAANPSMAQTAEPDPALTLPAVEVEANTPPENLPTDSASSKTVSGESMRERPAMRPGEYLEITPGLIVTQHSGEGKANQYYLRGFNLDHGTDLAITIDGMPANMRTHGHGQGYADVGFLIPELVDTLSYRKGPYFAEEGDFASAGAIHLDYVDKLEKNIVSGTIGSFGYYRGMAAGSVQAGQGWITGAGEATFYDGPWDHPDDLKRYNGMVRYVQGSRRNGFSLTGMGSSADWNSTDQIPQRAVDSGLIDRFGAIDPTDGGDSYRYSLSGRWAQSEGGTSTNVQAYAVRSNLNLYNNFTYFLDDPVNGDQFKQKDLRTILGVNASHTIPGSVGGVPLQNTFGVQTRYDDIDVGLFKTRQRELLSTVREDDVGEFSVGVYGESKQRWSNWFRTTVGLRGDWYYADVSSDNGANSGQDSDFVVSPKLGMVFGPFAGTEFFANAGQGFHSNDVRGTTITVDPSDGITPADRVPLLVKSQGAEVGVRTRAIEGLDSSLAFFVLKFDSEILFVGDAGTTEASRPSRRVGFEWNNDYRLNSWLAFDLDLAWTKARFTDDDPAGDYIPGAPEWVGSAGVELGELLGWFAEARYRYFGGRPLIEDDSVRSNATGLLSARIGYRFDNGVTIALDGFNLLDVKQSQIDYFYTSRLNGEPAGGVDDIHFHPVEPLGVRLMVSAQF
jgi:outer membrane receptor protein involved in Fe transport